ncbi:MAG: tRNA (5-methylaminomethyl-2-thiouridine)(34)-methyltransferase MnmD [Spirochaetales bacterium]
MATDSEPTPDIDFSGDDGWAESRLVFLGGNHLPARWQGRERFVVSELGFGTGLNALALAKLWTDEGADHPVPRLLFQSVELFPRPLKAYLAHGDRWPELATLAKELADATGGLLATGWHHWNLSWGELRLFVGDAASLPTLTTSFEPADAWFLDGYAPAKDSSLWHPELLAWVAGQTLPGGTAATYTAAGTVKQGLRSAGFAVIRRPGWGRKRHRLEAHKDL